MNDVIRLSPDEPDKEYKIPPAPKPDEPLLGREPGEPQIIRLSPDEPDKEYKIPPAPKDMS